MPLHLAVLSGGLLINNGTVFPGTQSRERSALAAAGPGWLVFREDTGKEECYLSVSASVCRGGVCLP